MHISELNILINCVGINISNLLTPEYRGLNLFMINVFGSNTIKHAYPLSKK